MEKKIRKKKCVVCGNSFTPYKTTQRVCSPGCAITFAREKKKKEKSDLQNFRESLRSGKKLQKLMESTTKLVHAYIRKRDKWKPCISCGCNWKPDFQAGHFYNKKQFHGIRFDLDNIHGQCQQCNLYNEGNMAEYAVNIEVRIGKERFTSLQKRAAIAKRFPHSFTMQELKEIQAEINKLSSDLTM